MSLLVRVQAFFHSKLFMTDITLKLLFVEMDILVCSQMSLPCEPLVAYRAFKLPIRVLFFHMRCFNLVGFKMFITYLARESALRCVNGVEVIFKSVFRFEHSVALWTFNGRFKMGHLM